MTAPRVIDSREIGGGASITLREIDGMYSVGLDTPNMEDVGSFPVALTPDRADALDAYRHPFARPHVPDIFKCEPALPEVT